jgi:uncharacterized membrane protein YeaQ/YmgE (transglycosylase-associated protein family)
MLILWFVIIGAAVGAVSDPFWSKCEPGEVIIKMLLGIAGSLVAEFVVKSLGFGLVLGHPASYLVALTGAVVLLVAYWLMVRRVK